VNDDRGRDQVQPSVYAPLLEAVKQEIASSRVRAARVVNTELIGMHWRIGRLILDRQTEQGWGSRTIDRLATDLRAEFPGSRGFSRRNLHYMRARVDLLSARPVDRAWPIAHELSHVLRCQEGARPAGASTFLALAAILVWGALGAVAGAGWAMLHGVGPWTVGLAIAAVGQVGGLWLVLLALLRREESATDAMAAAVFGEVLTAAGVARLRRREGALSPYVPTVLRSHPHPRDRRTAGRAARDQLAATN